MSEHVSLLELLETAQRIELVCDNMHIHPVEYYRPQGLDKLYAQVSDSTFVAGKYSKVVLTIYSPLGRFESPVKITNVPGVVCLLQVSEIRLDKKEQREIIRVEALKEVQLTINKRLYNATLKNISLGGCCFQTESTLLNTNGTLHVRSLKEELINLDFNVVKERIDQSKDICTYHCKFQPYGRVEERLLEREIVDLQLQQLRYERNKVKN